MQGTVFQFCVVVVLGWSLTGCKSVPSLAWWKSNSDAAETALAENSTRSIQMTPLVEGCTHGGTKPERMT